VAEGKKGGWFSHGRLREWRGEKGVRRLQGALFYWHTEVGDDWRGGAMWQARAGRERGGGGCPIPTGGRDLTGSGPRPTGAGGVARPCRVAGPNRGGQGVDGWAPATLEGGGG
jgi:hypothetical protein